MQNILLIDEAPGRNDTFKQLFELQNPGSTVFTATTEKEVLDHLKNNNIDIILLEPLLDTNALDIPPKNLTDIEEGEVGFILSNKIFDHIRNSNRQYPRLVLFSAIEKEILVGVGNYFPEQTEYFRKPMRVEILAKELKNLTIKKVLVIDTYPGKDSFAETLSNYGERRVFLARTEKEAVEYLKNNIIDVIVFEPLLGIDVLDKEPEVVREAHIGGVGFLLWTNLKGGVLKSYKKQPKLIICSLVSKDNLLQVGFQENIPYFKKPEHAAVVAVETDKE